MPFNDHYSYPEFQFIPVLHRLLYNISNSVTGCCDALTRNHFRNTPYVQHYNKKTLYNAPISQTDEDLSCPLRCTYVVRI